jgi:hypothetical protein
MALMDPCWSRTLPTSSMSSASDGDVHQHDVDLDSGLGDFSENPSPSSIATAAEGTADDTHDEAQTACVFSCFTTATHYIDCHACRVLNCTQLHLVIEHEIVSYRCTVHLSSLCCGTSRVRALNCNDPPPTHTHPHTHTHLSITTHIT